MYGGHPWAVSAAGAFVKSDCLLKHNTTHMTLHLHKDFFVFDVYYGIQALTHTRYTHKSIGHIYLIVTFASQYTLTKQKA